MNEFGNKADRLATLQRHVAILARSGYTTREIAERVGKEPRQIKGLREAGERLLADD